jgi:hypothetical protein
VDDVPTIVPPPINARRDVPVTYRNGCHDMDHPSQACVLGEPNATFSVAVVGDSHAAQWIPAIEAIAATNHWRVLSYTKAGCALLYAEHPLVGIDDGCLAWNAQLRPLLTGTARPDLLLTASASREPRGDRSALVRATHLALAEIAAAGTTIVVLRDTPWPGIDIAECASSHRHQLTRCAVARGDAVDRKGQSWRQVQDEAMAGLTKVSAVDLTDAICPADPCAAVIGGVLVYYDAHHLTATYAASLAPRLGDEIQRALG